MTRRQRTCVLAVIVVVCLACALEHPLAAPFPTSTSSLAGIPVLRETRPGARPLQMTTALAPMVRDTPWQPRTNVERTRGASQQVYPKVAVATVVVRTPSGHGTGFLIAPDGWLLTNHHVIASAPLDLATGAPVASVYLGELRNEWMQLQVEALPALLFKDSPELDLALLKLTRLPAGRESLPIIPLSDKVPAPGSSCVVIGHPKAGMLWTVRSGELSGNGVWPTEMIDIVMGLLASTSVEQEQLRTMLNELPKRKVLITSCGLNPGDSGGPLVDSRGRLIGVSFAIPRGGDAEGISLDKFSYHVHLDEVREFLRERPTAPLVRAPDPWPPGLVHLWYARKPGDRPEALAFAMSEGTPPTGILFDLDADSEERLFAEEVPDLDLLRRWDFEFAIQDYPVHATFYDTDHSGNVDLVLIDNDMNLVADCRLRLTDGRWAVEATKGGKLFDASYFTNATLAKRFRELKLDEVKSDAAVPPPVEDSSPSKRP